MNDNLPEINFKEKKEKKGGALGWLRGRLGFGSRGAIGEAGINPSVMNVGSAIGAGGGKFGASSGIAALLAGKAGVIATVAMVAVATGVYMANNAPAPMQSTSAFSSDKAAKDNYVPAILRSQAANQGSSLDMFKETNKGAGLAMEADPSKANKPPEAKAEAAAGEDAQAQDANQPAPGGENNMAQDMMAKLQGGNMASLTSSLGGGSNKFSNMGGFSNKFGSGATGAKTGFSSGIGSGFSSMPKFDQRKNKMMAMKSSARPVFGGSKAGKRGTFGSGAFSQAKGMRATQRTYSGSSVDSARSTQDKAWEGTTNDGSADTGAGISDGGGAGVVTSPSLDNTSSGGGGGDTGVADTSAPDASAPTDVSPWADAVSMAMTMILLSCVLSAVGAYLISLAEATAAIVGAGGWLYTIGMALCLMAALMAAYAIWQAITIMTQHGQGLLGTVYLLGGAAAMAAAIVAMSGTPGSLSGTALVLAAAGGVIALIGSMLGAK